MSVVRLKKLKGQAKGKRLKKLKGQEEKKLKGQDEKV